jgi:hypothetical protein
MSVTGAALTDPEITGGVYLGGTGSANYLEDYEEGTWTPVVGGGSMSVDGYYVKTGRLVHVVCTVYDGTLTGASGVTMTGLPFLTGNKRSATSGVAYYNLFDKDHVVGIVLDSSSKIDFIITRSNTSWIGANFRNSNSIYLHFTATYYTDY